MGTQLRADLEDSLNAALMPEEVVLWKAQPLRERWDYSQFRFSLLNPAIWKFLLMGRFMANTLRDMTERTGYVVTNRRALIIIVGDANQQRIRSISADELSERSMKIYDNGSGDLAFPKAQISQVSLGHGKMFPKNQDDLRYKIGFYGVSDVRSVDDLIRQTFQQQGHRPRDNN